MSDSRFDRAVVAFRAAHAEDPRLAEDGGTQSERYHEAVARWIGDLDPGAPEPVRLAAWCQHIRRWTVPRSDFPTGPAGYKRWRSQLAVFHGREASSILLDAGYDEEVTTRVRGLLLKKNLRSDPEVQLLEDAVCLTFLERDFAAFAAKHPDDKVIDILQKTWEKMGEAGRSAALGLVPELPGHLADLVKRALAG